MNFLCMEMRVMFSIYLIFDLHVRKHVPIKEDFPQKFTKKIPHDCK